MKKLNIKIKKFGLLLIVAFVAIVSALTASQYVLMQKAIANATKPYVGIYDDTEANAALTTMLVNADHDISDELEKSGNTFVLVSQPEGAENSSDEAVLSVSDNKENSGSVLVSNNSYTYVVDYKDTTAASEAVNSLGSTEGVFVSSDFIFHVAGNFSGHSGEIGKIDTIDVAAALEEGKSLREIADENGLKLVAVIDTGVNNVADYSVDFTGSGIEDANGHGTNVAKTILANADGKALIVSLKAMDDDGTGKMTNVYQALQWAKDQRADIVNMSITAFDDGTVESRAFRNLVTSLIENNVTVVAAAGNFSSETSRYIPAGIEGVISAGTIDENMTKTVESNYGNVTYYEQTASTSEAAAVITGKLASGSEDAKQSLIKEEDVAITDKGIADRSRKYTGFLTAATNGSMSWKSDPDDVFEAKIYYQYEWSGQNLRIRFYARVDHMNPYYHGNYYSSSGNFEVEVQVNGRWYSVGDVGDTIYYDSGVDSSAWSEWVTIAPTNGKVTVEARSWISKPDGYYATARLPAYTAYDTATFTVPGNAWNVNQNVYNVNAPGTATIAEFNEPNVHNAIGTFRYNGGSEDVIDAYNATCVAGTSWSVENVKPGRGLYLKSVTDNGSGTMPNSAKTVNVVYDFVTMTIDPGANGTYDHASGLQTFCSKDMLWDASKITRASSTGYTVRGNPWKGNSITLAQPDDVYYHVRFVDGVNADQTIDVPAVYDQTNPWKIASSQNPNTSYSIGTLKQGTVSGLTYTYGNYNDTLVPNATYTFTLPAPEKFGYELKGWYTGQNGTGTKIGDGGQTVTMDLMEDVTYYAYFEQKYVTLKIQGDINNSYETKDNINGIGSYKLKYQTGETDDGHGNKTPIYTTTGPMTSYNVSLPYGTRYEILDINGSDYYTYNTGSAKNQNHSGQLKADTTAKIAYDGISYTVVFDKNDDGRGNIRPSGSVPSISGTYGLPVTIPTSEYTWRGREFRYWSNDPNADPEGTAYITPGQSTTEPQRYIDLSTKTAKLYAIWKVNETTVTVLPSPGNYSGSTDPVYYTNAPGVTQELEIPSPPEGSVTITYDKNADDAILEHTSDTVSWAFKGWRLNDDATGYLTDNTHYVHDMTFDTLQAEYYYASIALPTPTREGYTFLGWYEDTRFRKKAGNAGATNYHAPGDITLFARWHKDQYVYSDTVEVFVNDDNEDRENQLMFRKIDAVSGLPLKSINVEGTSYSFKFDIYEGSVSPASLVYKIDTQAGLLNTNGSPTGVLPDENGYIVLADRLELGKTYIIRETEAAPGYGLAADITFELTEEFSSSVIEMVDQPFTTNPPPQRLKDDEYGRPISNAVFDIIDSTTGETLASWTTNENGTFDDNLFLICQPGHTITLQETDAPDGFGIAAPVSFDMPTSPEEETPDIGVVETVITKELEIKKEDSDGHPLAGAEFQLFMKDENGVLIPVLVNRNTGEWEDPENPSADAIEYKQTTGANGIASFKNLPLRATYTGAEEEYTKSYYLVETKAPEGYTLLPHEIEIRLPDDGAAKATYTVKDGTVRLTLSAGGNGTIWYLAFGGLLLSAGAAWMILKNRKQEEYQ